MHLKYITLSDPRDHNTFDELFDLWNIDPRVEIAVQMHNGNVSPDTTRYNWIKQTIDKLYIMRHEFNLAMHINKDWCDDICNGKIPTALKPFFDASSYYTYRPLVQRIQLNMPQNTAENFNPQKLKNVIDAYNDKEFIIQYKQSTINAVEQLHKTGAKFSLLFDESGGNSKQPKSWQAPIYPDKHPMGYAGGLNPENIQDNLNKIKKVAGNNQIWTDVEGGITVYTGLKKPDGTPIKRFSTPRAKEYVYNTLAWEQKHR